jgi:Mg-chelatase subunit ChlD
MPVDDAERRRRWRLVLGEPAGPALGATLAGDDAEMDAALGALYEQERGADLSRSSPKVARWLGDIRDYFPSSVVRVMQKDAMERLGLQQMLLEPEPLETVEPDVHLVATLMSLGRVIPQRTRETARAVVRKVVSEVERRLRERMIQSVRGSLARSARTRRPRAADIDFDRTIRANLCNYDAARRTVVAERLVGRRRRNTSLADVVLCVDQSGSMAPSVVYSSIFAAVLASIRSVTTRLVVFDTAVVDLTDALRDPVDVLFGTQLGGGTDIARALACCQGLITRPAKTVLVLVTDLYEGGKADDLVRRAAAIQSSGVTAMCLLALSDQGAPAYDAKNAAALAALGIPCFACTPDLFPDLMASALSRRDLGVWAARNEVVAVRAEG